jgi:hypothetical protein
MHGEHGRDILRQAGFDDRQIDELAVAGAVQLP